VELRRRFAPTLELESIIDSLDDFVDARSLR
jgi:hypothetical protein